MKEFKYVTAMQAGRTCSGSDAAKGIAPSVMKARPMMKLVGPEIGRLADWQIGRLTD